jgi:hypothetical protein
MTISLSCLIRAADLERGVDPDIILLPEGAAGEDVTNLSRTMAGAVVVGAVNEAGRSRAILLQRRQYQIAYFKINSDGQTRGVGAPPPQLPIWADACVAIGVVVCMDVREGWVSEVVSALRSAPSSIKVLCIPGDMSADWFLGDVLQPYLHGVHVALCNHVRTHKGNRCKSFVTDLRGRKRVVQSGIEALNVKLPFGEARV